MTEDIVIKEALDRNTPDLLSISADDILTRRTRGGIVHSFNRGAFAAVAAAAAIAVTVLVKFKGRDDEIKIEPTPVTDSQAEPEAVIPKGYLAADLTEQLKDKKEYEFEIPGIDNYSFRAESEDGRLSAEVGNNVWYIIERPDVTDWMLYYQDITGDGIPELILNYAYDAGDYTANMVRIADTSVILENGAWGCSFKHIDLGLEGYIGCTAGLVNEHVIIKSKLIETGAQRSLPPSFEITDEDYLKGVSSYFSELTSHQLSDVNYSAVTEMLYSSCSDEKPAYIYRNINYNLYHDSSPDEALALLDTIDLSKVTVKAADNIDNRKKRAYAEIRYIIESEGETYDGGEITLSFIDDKLFIKTDMNDDLYEVPGSFSYDELIASTKDPAKTEIRYSMYAPDADTFGAISPADRAVTVGDTKIGFIFENPAPKFTDNEAYVEFDFVFDYIDGSTEGLKAHYWAEDKENYYDIKEGGKCTMALQNPTPDLAAAGDISELGCTFDIENESTGETVNISVYLQDPENYIINY